MSFHFRRSSDSFIEAVQGDLHAIKICIPFGRLHCSQPLCVLVVVTFVRETFRF